MKNKLTTIIIAFVTISLLVMVIYIGSLLQSEKPTTITTIKKTKASSITYSKTVDINNQAETLNSETLNSETTNPTVTPVYLASGSVSPTITPMITSMIETPAISSTAQFMPTNTLVPTKKQTLPVTGKVDFTATILALASLLIFISFIY